jgi:hypothetical protein
MHVKWSGKTSRSWGSLLDYYYYKDSSSIQQQPIFYICIIGRRRRRSSSILDDSIIVSFVAGVSIVYLPRRWKVPSPLYVAVYWKGRESKSFLPTNERCDIFFSEKGDDAQLSFTQADTPRPNWIANFDINITTAQQHRNFYVFLWKR